MQLIAGRTAQEYNHHKNQHGAFWEPLSRDGDEADEHLHRAVEDIDGAYTLRDYGEAYDGD